MAGDEQTGGDSLELAATTAAQSQPPAADSATGRSSADRVADMSRFMIIDELGAGGMGVVLSAYDPELDRKLAIKVLRTERFDPDDVQEGRRRLLREAQAMGRLSHPNVITVFEVGQTDDDVYLAMEYVDGGTLSAWLEQRHDWRDVVDVFTQAGRGVAAAHAAGMVHRDFKPDNVLIGSDGRVRVTDFGLVGISAGEMADDEDPELLPIPHLDVTLTRVGALVGTPRYMAPEQHRREPVDARADQFSFCVALYEALCGCAPFAGDDYRSLRDAVLTGELTPPPRGDVPRHLLRVVERGLAVDPDARYPSMTALLDDLTYDPAVRKRRVAAGAAVAVLMAAAVYGLTRGGAAEVEKCPLPTDKLVGVWDADTKTAVGGNFRRSNAAYAVDALGRVTSLIDDYSQRWQRMRVEACRATHVRGEQSEALLDLRMACLDRRLDELRSLTSLLATSRDQGVLRRSVDAAFALTPLRGCADRAALTAATPPPESEALRRRVAELRRRLAAVDILRKAYQVKRALGDATSLEQATRKVDYVPLRAEVLLLLGLLQSQAGKAEANATLQAAAAAAAASGDDRKLARAQLELVRVRSHLQAKYGEALAMLDVVAPVVDRAGNEPRLRAQLLIHRGTVYKKLARYDDGARILSRAVTFIERELGTNRPLMSQALHNLANLYLAAKNHAQARATFRRHLKVARATFGEHHPRTAGALQGMAIMTAIGGDPRRASEIFRKVVRIREAALGPGHPRVAASLSNVGLSLMDQKKYAEARPYFLRAVKIWTAALGPKHPNITSPMIKLAKLSLATGDREAAVRWFRRAHAVLQQAYPNGHPRLTALRKQMAKANVKPNSGSATLKP